MNDPASTIAAIPLARVDSGWRISRLTANPVGKLIARD